jgi:hypothetical protein
VGAKAMETALMPAGERRMKKDFSSSILNLKQNAKYLEIVKSFKFCTLLNQECFVTGVSQKRPLNCP